MAERGARGDVVTHAARDAHANGGEGSLQRDVAAAGGGLHSGDGDGPVLIVHANASGDGLERDSAEGSVDAASPLTSRAVTEPLEFSTMRLPATRSMETAPKLVLA